jgi:hypothetical protein
MNTNVRTVVINLKNYERCRKWMMVLPAPSVGATTPNVSYRHSAPVEARLPSLPEAVAAEAFDKVPGGEMELIA